MRRETFVAFLFINLAIILLASAKTIVLVDNGIGRGESYSSMQQGGGIVSSEDSDVINFCRMCKSYVDLYQQADDTVEIRMPLESLCDDVEDNDQNLCLESIDNLHRLSTFDDLSSVNNLEVCQLVSLCEDMSSSEEDEREEEYESENEEEEDEGDMEQEEMHEVATGSDSMEDTASDQVMESSDGNVEQLLEKATKNFAHLSNDTHPRGGPITVYHPPPPVAIRPPGINNHNHTTGHHQHHHNIRPHGHPQVHGSGHGHVHGSGHGNLHQDHSHHHHHKHHSGATSNVVFSSAVLFSVSILMSHNFGPA